MSSLRRCLLLAAVVVSSFAAVPAHAEAPSLSWSAGGVARARQFGPYRSASAAWAKARALQAQGYSTIVTQGHGNSWWVVIV